MVPFIRAVYKFRPDSRSHWKDFFSRGEVYGIPTRELTKPRHARVIPGLASTQVIEYAGSLGKISTSQVDSKALPFARKLVDVRTRLENNNDFR